MLKSSFSLTLLSLFFLIVQSYFLIPEFKKACEEAKYVYVISIDDNEYRVDVNPINLVDRKTGCISFTTPDGTCIYSSNFTIKKVLKKNLEKEYQHK